MSEGKNMFNRYSDFTLNKFSMDAMELFFLMTGSYCKKLFNVARALPRYRVLFPSEGIRKGVNA